MSIDPQGRREPCYQRRAGVADRSHGRAASTDVRSSPVPTVPDTYVLHDAARLAGQSMLARLDLQRGGQPFFRIYPFAHPPRAAHEKWDDGDMAGRYVEALILARHLSGLPMDPREQLLRSYLAGLFDPKDGLCYTRGTDWTPRRACLFSQSSAMLGLLAWHRETGSAEARQLLDRQVAGLMRLAASRSNYACFPKYEWDGARWVDEPKDKDAPPWYGGRLILPLVDYWTLCRSTDVASPVPQATNSLPCPSADEVQTFLEKLIRYVVEVSPFIKPDGSVEQGEGWWGHLHGTMDMAAGIAEYGRLARRPELVAWAARLYQWIGRTQTTRYGWMADVAGGRICESCGIASRVRLGLALYRAGAADPYGEVDRFLRNQLLENQFVDLEFLAPLQPQTPRTEREVFAGIDRMIRGTFQCWGTANDLIGHDDIEGCGAGGGVQGLALAWNAQAEWRPLRSPGPGAGSDERTSSIPVTLSPDPAGEELRIHLLFNRRIRARPQPPFANTGPLAAELWSFLPQEGRVKLTAYQRIGRAAFRLPDGADPATARVLRSKPPFLASTALPGNRGGRAPLSSRGDKAQTKGDSGPRTAETQAERHVASDRVIEFPRYDGPYVLVENLATGEEIDLRFALRQYETTERAAGVDYRVHWKGSSVTSLEPRGTHCPLYANRTNLLHTGTAPLGAPRYP